MWSGHSCPPVAVFRRALDIYTLIAYLIKYTLMAYSNLTTMEFIEAPAFTRHVADYLKDDAYRALQTSLAENPQLGDVMPGTGGFRKLRWADPRRGKGRRGGLRIVYFYFDSEQQIWLMTLYDKDEASDLSPEQKKALKRAIDAELKARGGNQARRGASRRKR